MDAVLKAENTVAPNNRKKKFIANPSGTSNAGLLKSIHHSQSSFLYQQNQQPPLLPLPTVNSPLIRPQTSTRRSRRNRNKNNMSQSKEVTPVVSFRPVNYGFRFESENMDSMGWVFNLSPPPSSLPLPKFCLGRSKLN
ncbi:hypothetical protein RJT34_25827 [Clitoria ternatea]|uniref:Uncharacterized protein n=1 Tax=Clitoria ternatea TaxID=43366 RepID=A0AAN9FQK9_CLITE